jgi:hypothetical protein
MRVLQIYGNRWHFNGKNDFNNFYVANIEADRLILFCMFFKFL